MKINKILLLAVGIGFFHSKTISADGLSRLVSELVIDGLSMLFNSVNPDETFLDSSNLFNQDAVLSNPKYRSALHVLGFIDEQLPKLSGPDLFPDKTPSFILADNLIKFALKDEYLRQRTLMYDNYIEHLKHAMIYKPFTTVLPIMSGVVTSLGAGAGGFYAAPEDRKRYVCFGGAVGAISSVVIAAALEMSWFVKYRFVLSSNLRYLRDNPDKDMLYKYELDYALKKLEFNIHDCAKDYLENKKPLFEELHYSIRKSCKENEYSTWIGMKNLLKMPTRNTKPKITKPEEIYRVLKPSLTLYDQEAQDLILDCFSNHVAAYNPSFAANKKAKQFLALVSPPGTGKSFLVEEIAKKLGLPCVTLCMSDVTAKDFQGNSENMGFFLEKLSELGVGGKNGILFLDELDRVIDNKELLSLILPIFERSKPTFYSPYFQRNIDMSNLLIIVAGNKDFTDEALLDRFNKRVDLSIVNLDEVIELALTSYLPKLLENGEVPPDFSVELKAYLVQLQEKGKALSFRDAQAKIDSLLARWRRMQFSKR